MIKIVSQSDEAEQPEESDKERASHLLEELHHYRDKRKQYETEEKWRQKELLLYLDKISRKSLSFSDGTHRIKGTKVRTERVSIDEDKLKKALGSAKYNKVTKRILDKDKLEEAVKNGDVDPNVVAQCSEVKPTEYVKTTINKLDPEELDEDG